MKLFGFRINFETRNKSAMKAHFMALLVSAALALTVPTQAFASYSNPSVTTIAQMRTDGALHVVEQRSFSFTEDYSAITWPFTGLNEKQEVEVDAVRIIRMDQEGNITSDWTTLEQVPFQVQWRDFVSETGGATSNIQSAEKAAKAAGETDAEAVAIPNDACSFDKRRDVLYIFPGEVDATTVIECDYVISNAALVYDDTAELYWDYSPHLPDVRVSNVNVQIQLPVPEGAVVVPGETVLAWGHGPEGTVEVRADGTVDYKVPQVRTGQYAQAHVLFPRSWLTNITVQSKLAKSGTRFTDAVMEEAGWVDSYSAGLINDYTLKIVMLAACILALVGAAIAWLVFGMEKRGVAITDKDASYDVEAAKAISANPALVGRLLRWNHYSNEDFVATLMSLSDRGVVQVVKNDEDPMQERLRISPSAKSARLTGSERQAMNIIFDEIGEGYQSVSIAEVMDFRDKAPKRLSEMLEKWQATLSAEVAQAKLFDRKSFKAAGWLAVFAALFVVAGIWAWAATHDALDGVALLATGVLIGAIAYNMPRRTTLGVEVEREVLGEADAPADAEAGAAVEDSAVADAGAEEEVAPEDRRVMEEQPWNLLLKTTSF